MMKSLRRPDRYRHADYGFVFLFVNGIMTRWNFTER